MWTLLNGRGLVDPAGCVDPVVRAAGGAVAFYHTHVRDLRLEQSPQRVGAGGDEETARR